MIFSNARSNALPDSSAPSFRAVSRGPSGSGAETQIPDAPHPLWLLRARRERPCGRRTAKERDKLAAIHSITLSARNSIDSEIESPMAFAAFRLMTSSNFTACSTGRSPGLAPLRTRSTYVARRRHVSKMLVK
jgi:hypothetical protein